MLYFYEVVPHVPAVAERRAKRARGEKRPGPGRPAILRNRTSLTAHVDGTDYATLAELAEERGVSLGTVVREAIATYIARRRKE